MYADYHPEEWNPIWHVGTILNATVSFMSAEDNTTGAQHPSQQSHLHFKVEL
jgi:ubiquitin-protein ligase